MGSPSLRASVFGDTPGFTFSDEPRRSALVAACARDGVTCGELMLACPHPPASGPSASNPSNAASNGNSSNSSASASVSLRRRFWCELDSLSFELWARDVRGGIDDGATGTTDTIPAVIVRLEDVLSVAGHYSRPDGHCFALTAMVRPSRMFKHYLCKIVFTAQICSLQICVEFFLKI